MREITPESIRQFLISHYEASLLAMNLDPETLPDDFDFLIQGIVDSFGILEMISAIEDEFRVQLDMATLDAEQITILGPLSRYVAEHARREEV